MAININGLSSSVKRNQQIGLQKKNQYVVCKDIHKVEWDRFKIKE